MVPEVSMFRKPELERISTMYLLFFAAPGIFLDLMASPPSSPEDRTSSRTWRKRSTGPLAKPSR